MDCFIAKRNLCLLSLVIAYFRLFTTIGISRKSNSRTTNYLKMLCRYHLLILSILIKVILKWVDFHSKQVMREESILFWISIKMMCREVSLYGVPKSCRNKYNILGTITINGIWDQWKWRTFDLYSCFINS